MFTSEDRLSIANIREGAVVEAFDAEIENVLENMQDPNTNPTAVREITLKLKIKPDADRSVGEIEATVWPSKLAPRRVITSKMVMGVNSNGLIEAHEFTTQQLPLFPPIVPGTVVDAEFDNDKVTRLSSAKKEA